MSAPGTYRRASWLLMVAVGLSRIAASCHAADDASLQAALAQTLLPAGTPVREMRAFIEPRIVRLEAYGDRASWEQAAGRWRRDMLEQIVFRGAAAGWRDAPARVVWLDTIAGGRGYTIRKFRYEVVAGMWVPGLLYVPDKLTGRVPLAVHVNGHAPEGKAVAYKQLRSITWPSAAYWC
jgi:hypothetical protein